MGLSIRAWGATHSLLRDGGGAGTLASRLSIDRLALIALKLRGEEWQKISGKGQLRPKNLEKRVSGYLGLRRYL